MDSESKTLHDRFQGLVICLSHSWGGLEQVAANDSVDLANQGLIVKVMCLEGSPIHENLVHRQKLGPIPDIVPLNFRPRNHLDFKLRAELNRLIDGGVNLIHSHQTSILGSVVPWLWNRPSVSLFATRHILNNHSKRTPYHRLLYGRMDGLLVISRTVKQNVLSTHWIPPGRVKVVHLGLDFDLFDPERVNPDEQRAKWGADEDTIVIGLVGRIDPAKGQATFIKSAAGLLKHLRAGEKLKFVIVGEETLGSSTNHLQELKEMVSQFHLEENVVFAGYQENIPEVMRAFDIFVMPSKQEAFGLVAIEAMAMECPIVISSGGSAAEIVGSEEYGLIMKPDDPYDLQRQLRHLLDNPMQRVQMGQRAREHVKSHYDRKTRVQRTLELYENALKIRSVL